jgi:hypothetical protein
VGGVLSDEFELVAARHTPFDSDSPYVFGKSGATKFTTVGASWHSLSHDPATSSQYRPTSRSGGADAGQFRALSHWHP